MSSTATESTPIPLDRYYLNKMLDILPVSVKHHTTYKMLLFPSNHALFLVDDARSLLMRNVADFQLHHMIEAKPDVIAGIFGVTVTPEKSDSNSLGWVLLLSVKAVPVAVIEPATVSYKGIKKTVVDKVLPVNTVLRTI